MDTKISLPATILWINDTVQNDSYSVKPHAHGDYCHLTYIENGRCHLMLNGKHYEMLSGMFAIASPDDTHCIESVAKGESIRLWEIKFIATSQTIRKIISKTEMVLSADDYEMLQLNEVITLGKSGTGRISAVNMAFGSFLFHLCARLDSSLFSSHSSYLYGINTSGFSRATVETVRYIEKNFSHDISLEDIGQAIGYNKNYISTMVKHDLTINVNDIICFIRVHEAAEKLYYSDESIHSICSQCGFKTVSHFSRIFKKYIGIPPAQYRRSYPENAFNDPSKDDSSSRAVPLWGMGTLNDYIESCTK